jgi:hypothetical protein
MYENDYHFSCIIGRWFAVNESSGEEMSLNVSEALIQQAAAGDVDELAFVETIRQSLPYAWGIVEKLSHSIHQQGQKWANHAVAPPTEQARA